MANIITIPTPCNEDWNLMIPKDKGRNCSACCKTVVDFTNWQPQEIFLYFNTNKNVCGRFTADQLNEPMPTVEDFVKQISYFNISTLKKMAAIILFAFMIGTSGCNEAGNATGKSLLSMSKNTIDTTKTIVGDTVYTKAPKATPLPIIDTPKKLMGTPAIIKKAIIIEKPTVKGDVEIVERTIIMGEPAMEEQPILLGDTAKKRISVTLPVCQPIKIKENDFVMGKMVAPKQALK